MDGSAEFAAIEIPPGKIFLVGAQVSVCAAMWLGPCVPIRSLARFGPKPPALGYTELGSSPPLRSPSRTGSPASALSLSNSGSPPPPRACSRLGAPLLAVRDSETLNAMVQCYTNAGSGQQARVAAKSPLSDSEALQAQIRPRSTPCPASKN